jgi:hypothetical protein
MLTLARDHWLRSNRSVGKAQSAGRSNAAKTLDREPSRFAKRPVIQPDKQFPDRLI